ncbi:hypothetical protein KSF78_0006981 [Schistosoma japonicum]|nr:hypothetical protein KSF78_0006981 [Schistosoma japonicum]
MVTDRRMAENLSIDFVPPRLYIPCSEQISNYAKNQVPYLMKLRRTWSYRNTDILISHMLYIRFKNQLRHFLFFKSFSSVRRSLAQLCDGPTLNGISNFCSMSAKCKSGHCMSGHTLDHMLVCLIQLYKRIEILLTRLNSCWRSCDAQFTTGHFTKVLLLIMTVISSLRVQSINSLEEINCCYGNLFAVRGSLTNIKTWLSPDITLPRSLKHQTKPDAANENDDILGFGEVQTEENLRFFSVKETPDIADAQEPDILDKFLRKTNKKAKRLSRDTHRSLAAILPPVTTQKKQDDLLAVLLNYK